MLGTTKALTCDFGALLYPLLDLRPNDRILEQRLPQCCGGDEAVLVGVDQVEQPLSGGGEDGEGCAGGGERG